MLRIRIRDPGSGAFLTPGSGIRDGKKSASGSGIRDEQPGSYFLELRNDFFGFFGLKYLNSLMKIRDPVRRHFGSGMEKSRIRDPGETSRTRNTDEISELFSIFVDNFCPSGSGSGSTDLIESGSNTDP